MLEFRVPACVFEKDSDGQVGRSPTDAAAAGRFERIRALAPASIWRNWALGSDVAFFSTRWPPGDTGREKFRLKLDRPLWFRSLSGRWFVDGRGLSQWSRARTAAKWLESARRFEFWRCRRTGTVLAQSAARCSRPTQTGTGEGSPTTRRGQTGREFDERQRNELLRSLSR